MSLMGSIHMKKERDLRLDLLRVLAIIGVVVLHVAGGEHQD